jgi:hypothetical protein
MTLLKCTVCGANRPTEKTMYEHLKAEHAEQMRGHLNIVDNFSCEKDSELWHKMANGKIKPLNQTVFKNKEEGQIP